MLFVDVKILLLKDFLIVISSIDFDVLVIDIVVSFLLIDFCGDNDFFFKGSKYYFLKWLKKFLVFLKNFFVRFFFLDNLLDFCNDCLMEKFRILVVILLCIWVEEYYENCGCFERLFIVEFYLGFFGFVIIDMGFEYY